MLLAIENLTTYTEVDTGGFITESASKVTITAMTSQTDCYLYKDFTANHFDALDIDYEIYVQNEEANKYGHAGIAVTNTLNDIIGFADTDISVKCSTRGSNVLWFRLSRGNFTESDYDALSTDTLYYCTLSRSAGSGTVVNHVYSDSARTTEVATQTITGLTAATKWRYLMGCVNLNLGIANRLSTGYIQNIDLNEVVPVVCTPGTLDLALTFYAPVVTGISTTLTPGTLSLALTFYTPTVIDSGNDIIATPGTLPLSLTFYNPNVIKTESFPSANSLKVGIAFVDTPLETSPTWSYIQDDVREIHTTRGRNHELDRMESGTLDIVLNNESGNYWPDNSGGDYYDDVDVMKKINIQAYYDGWHDVFTGYVESYTPSFLSGSYGALMTLHCVGILGKIVSLQVLNNAGYLAEADGTRVDNVLDDCGIPSAWITSDTGDYTLIASGALENVNALDHLQKVQETSLSLLYELPDGTILYESRGHRNAEPHLTSQATFGDGVGEIGYSNFTYMKDEVLLFNDVRITREGGTEQVVTNSTSQTAYGKRSYVKTGTLHNTDTMAWLTADFIASRYALCNGRVESMTIVPDNSDKWTQVFSREISDRITFKHTDSGVDRDFFIESVNHDWNFTNGEYSTTYSLSDATQYLTPPDDIDEILRPSGAGTTQLTIRGSSPAATNWEGVDEVVADDGITYNRCLNSNLKDLYDLPSSAYSTGTINSVIHTIRCNSSYTAHTAYPLIKASGVEYENGIAISGPSWVTQNITYTTNPNTGLAWTWDDVNSLQVGVRFNIASNWDAVTQTYATVNFTPTW
jgi:hypothetical protein